MKSSSPFYLRLTLDILCWNYINPTFASIFFNVIQKVKLEVDKPHHVSFFVFNSFPNMSSNVLKKILLCGIQFYILISTFSLFFNCCPCVSSFGLAHSNDVTEHADGDPDATDEFVL